MAIGREFAQNAKCFCCRGLIPIAVRFVHFVTSTWPVTGWLNRSRIVVQSVTSFGPAEAYEDFLVPALFQEWAERVADAADLIHGERVLDVACGTGVLARAVFERVGPRGVVAGVDRSVEMLSVARKFALAIDYRQGPAENLPFENDQFDVVVSQFGLMYFDDQPAAVREMMRVLRPGGRLAVAVFDQIERSPGYSALARLVENLFGSEVADPMRAPHRLGDPILLHRVFVEAGIPNARITTRESSARFPSVKALLLSERACGRTLTGFDDEQFELLQREAESVLRPFVLPDGSMRFAVPAHLVRATKPRLLNLTLQ